MRSLPWKTLAAGLAVAVTFAACADIFGIKGADTGDASLPGDGGGGDVVGDTIPPYDASKDVITIPDANLAQCDGGIDDLTGAVFVSNTHPNLNTTGCGAATKPCSSIKIGIGVAVQQAPHKVVLANDTFDEVVELDQNTPGITIEGGYVLDYNQKDVNGNPAWVPQCATNLAKIVEGTTHPEPYVVRMNGASNITLRLMSIQSRDSKNYGESVYGVEVIGSSPVTLDNVVVLAENGGDGLGGGAGASNNPPTFCGIDAGGSTGGNAGAGSAGSFQSDGYHSASAPTGGNGEWGKCTPPQSGVCDDCNTCFNQFVGDAGQQCSGTTVNQCAGTGGTGCNGPRGLGGGGGTGGGATVALFLYGSSNVTLLNGTAFLTANGGRGGNGASGGTGGAGTNGDAGFSILQCATACGVSGDGGCQATSTKVLEGGAGGTCGSGGSGGTGGGGAGGPSYLVVRVNPAALSPSFVNSVGDAGPGRPGDGGAPNGVTGDQASIKVF